MRISIIIPVYNKIRYISDLLENVRVQTFSDFECLLIDDGSTDGSGDVCDRFAAADARFRVFHIPNGGVSHARNVGLDAVQGECVTFIDSDDEICPEYLENLVRCREESGADMVISGYEKFWDDKADIIQVRHPEYRGNMAFGECLGDFGAVQRDTGLFGCCVSKLFSRTSAGDTRFDEELRLAEDLDFYLRLYPKIRSVYFDDRCLYRYRQDAENSSVQRDDSKIDYLAQLRINLRYRDFLKNAGAYTDGNREIVEKMLANYLYFSAFHCPEEMMDDRFAHLAAIQKREDIRFVSGSRLQKLLLTLLGSGRWKTAKFLVRTYRAARKAVKK